MAALPRAAAVADGAVLAGRHPRAVGLVPQPRTPAADDPVPADRLRRARHRLAARAGTAGQAGAGDRRRHDHRFAGRLVPRARLAPDRGRRPHPGGVPGTGPAADPALLPGDAHLAAAPEEPGLDGPRVHPGRAAGQHRIPATDADQAARRRAAAGRVHRRRPPWRPDRPHVRDLPAPGVPGPALPDGGTRALRPRRLRRRAGRWQVDAARRARIPGGPSRRPGDPARPVRPAGPTVRDAGAAHRTPGCST